MRTLAMLAGGIHLLASAGCEKVIGLDERPEIANTAMPCTPEAGMLVDTAVFGNWASDWQQTENPPLTPPTLTAFGDDGCPGAIHATVAFPSAGTTNDPYVKYTLGSGHDWTNRTVNLRTRVQNPDVLGTIEVQIFSDVTCMSRLFSVDANWNTLKVKVPDDLTNPCSGNVAAANITAIGIKLNTKSDGLNGGQKVDLYIDYVSVE